MSVVYRVYGARGSEWIEVPERQGPPGDQGPLGDTGPQGPQGDAGTQGTVGSLGATGDTGPPGPRGIQGIPGDPGTDGAAGIQGELGPVGQTGDSGAPGPTGEPGPLGPQGPIGFDGATGDAGSQGSQGPPGNDGATGPPGTTSWTGITDKPSTFTPASHAHPQSDVTSLVSDLAGKAASSHTHDWADVTGEPATYPPSTHAHAQADVTGLAATLALKQDASSAATDAELATHEADATSVHGIADTSALVLTDDARLSDQRVPTALSVTDAKVAAANKDGAAGTPSMRTLGTGAAQATAGNDTRLSDARTPLTHSHPQSEVTSLVTDLTNRVDKTLLDAKGDLLVASGADTPARLAVGTDTQVLTADAAQGTGVKWATPAGGGGGETLVGPVTVDQTSAVVALANITGLSFAVTSGLRYRFEAWIVFRTAALTTGIRFGATTPTITVYAAQVRTLFAADGAGGEFQGALTTSGDSVVSTAVPAINTDYLATVQGILQPSATGTFQLQFATEIVSTNAIVRPGSHILYRTI